MPEDVAKFYPAEHKDADGLYASFRIGLCIIAYNTNLVKAEDAPKSFADLLDPKWKGKIVKAHPGYSGTIMTATFQMQRDLGWDYLEKLAKQNVMQLQSSADPPKKLALGERAVQADGNEYNIFQIKENGRPGRAGLCRPKARRWWSGRTASSRTAPNPNAARLFQCFCFSAECQQLISDVGGQRSVHPQVKEKAGRKPFKEIKTMKEDAAGVEKTGEEIKAHYSQDLQGVRTRCHAANQHSPGATFSRAPSALAVGTVFAAAGAGGARRRPKPITPALIEAAKKEGKCAFYTAMDLQFAEKLGKDVRGEISRHRRARRALRRRARVHPHRPGVFEQHPCRRRGQHRRPVALHRLEAQRLARALPAGGGRRSITTSSTTIRTACT